MISSTHRAWTVSVLASTVLMGAAGCTRPPAATISVKEVCTAQKAWGDALVTISKAYDQGGFEPARAAANAAIDTAYGYKLGPVLFKPTLTQAPQTFRTTREGALAYFIGHDSNFPNDTGFAFNHWRSVVVRNVGVQINGDVANSMGTVEFRDKDGALTTVDKTWTFKKDAEGKVRIILHHSSLALPPAPGVHPPISEPDLCVAALAG